MIDLTSFAEKEERQADIADAQRIAALSALLDHEQPMWKPGMLPPLGHWLCFQPHARQSRVGFDGHPLRDGNGILPPSDLPRRMWAGSRIEFLGDIPLGSPIQRLSRLVSATPKRGRSGNMLFVTLRHEIGRVGDAAAIIEEQDIVYREGVQAGAPTQRPAIDSDELGTRSRSIVVDPVMLFRYSALTFNGHRIHYDRDYAQEIEGYPGLVVQGPLIATLLLDLVARYRPDTRIRSFTFRAMSPTFDGEALHLGMTEMSNEIMLRAINPVGVAMSAMAGIAT